MDGSALSQSSKGAGQEPRVCDFCLGSGQCGKCAGNGLYRIQKGLMKLNRFVTCGSCEGVGVCQHCRGRGHWGPALPLG
jgi:hypothetical protein